MATARKTGFRPSPVATPPPKPAPAPTPVQQARPSGTTVKPSPVAPPPPPPPQPTPSRIVITPAGLQTVQAPPPKPTPTGTIGIERKTEFRPSPVEPTIVQAPPPQISAQPKPAPPIVKTSIKQDEEGGITYRTTKIEDGVTQIASSYRPALVTEVIEEPAVPKPQVPLIPGVPGLLGGVIPLTAGAVKTLSQEREPEGFKLEGFKPSTSKGGAEALDISEKVLSEERFTIPETVTTREIPAVGEPTKETRQYIDPATGLLTTETKTTTPQPGVEIVKTGGESISQTIGVKPVKTDVSDPVGSLFLGATQSALNEYIGVKNIGALATGKEQEESYATPSGILFGGLFEAGKVVAEDVGSSVFNIGRIVAGKTPIEAGQKVQTIGIAGDVITVEQKPIQGLGKAYTALEESGQRAARIAEADPFYALGDIAVQVPLLVVAPVKAASLAIKGVGVAGKAVKGVTGVSKTGIQFIKGAEGVEDVIKVKPSKMIEKAGFTEVTPAGIQKTPLEKTFAEEYKAFEVKKPQVEAMEDFGKLSAKQREELIRSQREQFEQGVERLQTGTGRGRIGEETAEFTQSGITQAQRDIEKIRTTRISQEELSPALGARIKELEKTGKQADLFPEAPKRVSADDILNPEGFTSTKIDLGAGLGRFERGGEDLFGGGKGLPPEPPLPPAGGTRTVGDVIESTAKLQGITKAEARRLLEETGQIPPSVSDKAVLKGGTEAGGLFRTTQAELGKGAGSLLGDIGKVDDIGKSEDIFVLGKVTDSDIDKFSKQTKIPREDAEKLFRKADEQYGSEGQQVLLKNPDEVTKQSQKLFELEKARTALKKTNASKAISSIEDQATQKKLSDLIKLEKLKKPSTSADLATQKALKKLIAEEKEKIALKSIPKIAKVEEGIDILRAKPRGLAGLADEGVQVVRKPGSKLEPGIFGGVAVGAGIGTVIGLGLQGEGVKPQIYEQEALFSPQVTKLERDPLISIQRQFQEQPQIIKQQPKLTTRQEFVQEPSQRITELFVQAPKITTKKTAKTTNVFDITEQYKPIQETKTTTTEQLIPPGLGFGFPRGGGGDVTPTPKSGRKFFRVFDIAKTPFGRIEYGLGAQVQSDRPIFEFTDVLPKKQKGSKNVNEQFFSL